MIYGKEKTVDYLAGSKPSNIIPDGTPISEMIYYAIEDEQKNFNEVMMGIGVDELNYFIENGKEVEYGPVYEADNGKSDSKAKKIFDKMKGWLQSFWSNVQELIKKALDWLTDKSKNVTSKIFLNLNDKYLKDKVNNIKSDKNFGEMYKYDKLDIYSKNIQQFSSESKDITMKFITASNNSDHSDTTLDNLKSDMSDHIDKLLTKMAGKKVDGISEMTKVVKDQIRGKKEAINGKWVTDNWDKGVNIVGEVKKFPRAKATLNASYKVAKDAYNRAIGEAEKFYSNTKVADEAFNARAFTIVNSANETILRAITCCEQAVVDCVTERYRGFCSIAIKVATAANASKKAEEKAKHESATVSTVDMLNSLFEW